MVKKHLRNRFRSQFRPRTQWKQAPVRSPGIMAQIVLGSRENFAASVSEGSQGFVAQASACGVWCLQEQTRRLKPTPLNANKRRGCSRLRSIRAMRSATFRKPADSQRLPSAPCFPRPNPGDKDPRAVRRNIFGRLDSLRRQFPPGGPKNFATKNPPPGGRLAVADRAGAWGSGRPVKYGVGARVREKTGAPDRNPEIWIAPPRVPFVASNPDQE